MARLGKVTVKPLVRENMLEVVQRALLPFGLLKQSCSFHFFEFVALAVSCPSFKVLTLQFLRILSHRLGWALGQQRMEVKECPWDANAK